MKLVEHNLLYALHTDTDAGTHINNYLNFSHNYYYLLKKYTNNNNYYFLIINGLKKNNNFHTP